MSTWMNRKIGVGIGIDISWASCAVSRSLVRVLGRSMCPASATVVYGGRCPRSIRIRPVVRPPRGILKRTHRLLSTVSWSRRPDISAILPIPHVFEDHVSSLHHAQCHRIPISKVIVLFESQQRMSDALRKARGMTVASFLSRSLRGEYADARATMAVEIHGAQARFTAPRRGSRRQATAHGAPTQFMAPRHASRP